MVFFFNDTATTEIYTLSLHDALPIFCGKDEVGFARRAEVREILHLRETAGRAVDDQRIQPVLGHHLADGGVAARDRKSTRLNSSHVEISYAVFCLKKKKKKNRSILNE